MSGTFGPNEQMSARKIVHYANQFIVQGNEPKYDIRYDFDALRHDMQKKPGNTFENQGANNVHDTITKIKVDAVPEALAKLITGALMGSLATSCANALTAVIDARIKSGTQSLTVLSFAKMTQNLSIMFGPEPYIDDKYGAVVVYFSYLELFTNSTSGMIFEALSGSFQRLEFRYVYQLLSDFASPITISKGITAKPSLKDFNLVYVGPYTES